MSRRFFLKAHGTAQATGREWRRGSIDRASTRIREGASFRRAYNRPMKRGCNPLSRRLMLEMAKAVLCAARTHLHTGATAGFQCHFSRRTSKASSSFSSKRVDDFGQLVPAIAKFPLAASLPRPQTTRGLEERAIPTKIHSTWCARHNARRSQEKRSVSYREQFPPKIYMFRSAAYADSFSVPSRNKERQITTLKAVHNCAFTRIKHTQTMLLPRDWTKSHRKTKRAWRTSVSRL